MTTNELIAYIKNQLGKNIPKEVIISRLANAGWRSADIAEGMTMAQVGTSTSDKYRESPLAAVEPEAVRPNPVTVPVNPPQTFIQPSTAPAPAPELWPKLAPKIAPVPIVVPPVVALAPAPLPNTLASGVSKDALMASYKRDMEGALKANEKTVKGKRSSILKWIIILIVILGLGFGAVFAYTHNILGISSAIQLPESIIPKNDPKVAILAGKFVESNTSWKADTDISISFPSLSTPATADSVSAHAVTAVSADAINPPSFDSNITMSSSLLKNPVTTRLIYSGGTSYVTVPDLSGMLGVLAPAQKTVAVPPEGVGMALSLIPENIGERIPFVLQSSLVSNGISSSQKTEFLAALKALVTGSTATEANTEITSGQQTAHYLLTPTLESTKQFLSFLVSASGFLLSDGEQSNAQKLIDSATIDTFELWMGKDDNVLYRYSFVVSTRLPQIADSENNKITLGVRTNYYDIGVPVTVTAPTGATELADFMKEITDLKIKNMLQHFATAATLLKATDGGYGKKSNSSGSCINATAGSLFSQTGHAEASAEPVGTIADTLENLLAYTNGMGSCYSTTSAWAISVPLATSPTMVFCTDSVNASKMIAGPLKGTVCK